MNRSNARLCALGDLADPGSAVFPHPDAADTVEIMVIRLADSVFGYLNNCPHTGGPLDWVPGVFLDLEKRFIQCATHDALFRIADGECVFGPCAGQSLQPVDLVCEDGWVCYGEPG